MLEVGVMSQLEEWQKVIRDLGRECWECGAPLNSHTSHPVAGREFCGPCYSSMKQQARQEFEAELRKRGGDHD